MNPRLRALLAAIGLVTISGTLYMLATVRPGVSRADLLDAGITAECDPVQVACAGRDLCRNTLADGGLSPRYLTLRMLGYQCNRDGGDPLLILRVTQPNCFEPVGPPGDACQVLGATFDDGGLGVQGLPDRCACRARGQVCRKPDGGLMTFDTTYPAPFAQYIGAGCTRKVCSEMAGEQGQSMPSECQ